jgi:SH3-like domain-containing protein
MAMLRRAFFLLIAVCALPAQAIDYRSVEAPVAVLYDAPSQKAKKLYLLKSQTPVELVVRLEGWAKVRDAEGTLAWIESKCLGDKRTVVVIASRADVRQADRPDAPLAFEADKWVALDFVEPASPGWVKVRHRDGSTGYIKTTQIWGL